MKRKQKQIVPVRRYDKYNCMKCGTILEHSKGLWLTEYPIDWVFECPNCGTTHFLLADNVLCTEEDYESRVRMNYK